MKKIFAAAALVAALLIGDHALHHASQDGFASGYRAALATKEQTAIDRPENIYPTCGVVVEVDWSADTVTVEDAAGFNWTFYGAEDWMPGDVAALIMYNWGTQTIRDDEILDVKYCGTAEMLDDIAYSH